MLFGIKRKNLIAPDQGLFIKTGDLKGQVFELSEHITERIYARYPNGARGDEITTPVRNYDKHNYICESADIYKYISVDENGWPSDMTLTLNRNTGAFLGEFSINNNYIAGKYNMFGKNITLTVNQMRIRKAVEGYTIRAFIDDYRPMTIDGIKPDELTIAKPRKMGGHFYKTVELAQNATERALG